ncbi:MAG: hypothetical protein Q9M92_01440 [Enterobacterales bacterium]|nr:hypothetical protein [Enterobacterales bacterium]
MTDTAPEAGKFRFLRVAVSRSISIPLALVSFMWYPVKLWNIVGNSVRKLVAGDSLKEDFSTVHSFKNMSHTACVLIAFDIPVANK